MTNNFIVGARSSGKTRMMLENAKEKEAAVVCVNPAAMKRKAEAYGIVGLNFISYDDIIRSNQLYDGDVWIADKYVIDEIGNFLSAFFGGECAGFTQTEE